MYHLLKPFKQFLFTIISCLLIILSSSTSIALETKKAEPHEEKQAASDIVLWHSFDGPLGEKFEALVNRFNQQSTSKQLHYKIIPQYKGTYEQTLAMAQKVFNTPDAPHILQVYEMGNIVMQSNPKVYVPIDKLTSKPSKILKREHFIPFIYNFYKSRQGNSLASLPFSASSVIVFYNKDAFKKAGINPENPPKTWEEFEDIAKILKEKGAKNILASGWLSGHHLDQIGAWHNEPIATKGNGIEGEEAELVVNKSFFRHHLGKLAAWYQVGWFSLETGPQAEQAFAKEDIILLTQGSNRFPNLEKSVNGRFEIGVGKLPYWKDHAGAPFNTVAGGASFWALSGHKQAEYAAVQKFFEYLANPQVQSEWHQETGYMPVVNGATELAQKQGFYDKTIKGKAAKIALDSFSLKPPQRYSRGILLPNFPKVREIMVHEMKEAINGNKTSEAALEEIEKAGNKVMNKKAI